MDRKSLIPSIAAHDVCFIFIVLVAVRMGLIVVCDMGLGLGRKNSIRGSKVFF